MTKAAALRIVVDFGAKAPPQGYIVKLAPEGGEVVGSYGGSAQIDADRRASFESIPPGRYIVRGRPNPGSDDEETAPLTVELKGGEKVDLLLRAR
jgi:hypothetical protein